MCTFFSLPLLYPGLKYTKKPDTFVNKGSGLYKKKHETSQNVRWTFALRRPERSVDMRTVRTRQGSNIRKEVSFRIPLFLSIMRARDGIRTRDPRLGKAILGKISKMSDEEFEKLELYPDFDV